MRSCFGICKTRFKTRFVLKRWFAAKRYQKTPKQCKTGELEKETELNSALQAELLGVINQIHTEKVVPDAWNDAHIAALTLGGVVFVPPPMLDPI